MASLCKIEDVGTLFAPHIAELHEFFNSRGVKFGSSADIAPFVERISADAGFRDEMASMVRAVIYRARDGLARLELLELLLVAVGGTHVDDAAQEIHQPVRELLAFVDGAFRARWNSIPKTEIEPEEAAEDPRVPPASAEVIPQAPADVVGKDVPAMQGRAGLRGNPIALAEIHTEIPIPAREMHPPHGLAVHEAGTEGEDTSLAAKQERAATRWKAMPLMQSGPETLVPVREVHPADAPAVYQPIPEVVDRAAPPKQDCSLSMAQVPAVAPIEMPSDAAILNLQPLVAPAREEPAAVSREEPQHVPVFSRATRSEPIEEEHGVRRGGPLSLGLSGRPDSSPEPIHELPGDFDPPPRRWFWTAGFCVLVLVFCAGLFFAQRAAVTMLKLPNAAQGPATTSDSGQQSVATETPRAAMPETITPTPRPARKGLKHGGGGREISRGAVRTQSHFAPTALFGVSPSIMTGHLLYAPEPDYPTIAKLTHIEGQVVMEAVVASNGTVSDAEVLSGHRLLRGAALRAVRGRKYRPYLVNGKPTDVATILTVDFRLR